MKFVNLFFSNNKEIAKSMRTILQICFLVCYLLSNAVAQQWVKVTPTFNPPGNYNTYHGVFVNEREGWWLTLFPGTILHTTNKGISWETQVESCNAGIGGIVFIDSLHGWLQGQTLPNPEYEYFILNTKDGGKSWNRYSAPVLTCLTFFDSIVGFAGGEDTIYATTDGGITWAPQTVEPDQRFGITDIFFSDRKYGWAVGGSSTVWDAGVVLRTVDSGKTWQFNYPANLVGNAVYFKDSLLGCIVGLNPPFFSEGVMKVTSDGGVNWITHYLPSAWLNDVVFTNDSTGWAVGDYGFVWHTTDRGINWNQVESGTTSHLYRLFFFDNGNIGYIIGADSTLLKYDKTVGVKEEKPVLVTSFKVFQNYPNPFNSTTQIKFEIPVSGLVSLIIYNLLGKEVVMLLNEEKRQGAYTINWEGKDNYGRELGSGVYFYQLKAGSFHEVRKLIFLK